MVGGKAGKRRVEGGCTSGPGVFSFAEFRHYDIAVKPVGISRSVKAVLTSKLPDLSQFQDISDFVLK